MKKDKEKKFKIEDKEISFFRFRETKEGFLMTNDFGKYIKLTADEFDKFLKGKINKNTKLYKDLFKKGFYKKSLIDNKKELIESYRGIKGNLFNQGASLHIIALTGECNLSCIYCQAFQKKSGKKKSTHMDKDTAKKTVDFIFKTPNKNIVIEFQGGEPLANWDTMKFIVEYARKKEKESDKKLDFALVSNFTLMTEAKVDFFSKYNVFLCTSLDGPEELHNKNRVFNGGNNYKTVIKWIKKLKGKGATIGAVLTVSKHSLKYYKEIVDEYLNLGIRGSQLRPLSCLGKAKSDWEKIGYSAEEFISFWKKAMDYIIDINLRGVFFDEGGSRIMLQKIIENKNPGYTDLNSPCGAVLGQLLYNYDGKIYTCDEGRMLKEDTFLIGDIHDEYENVVMSDKTKATMISSCLENTFCDYCVYGAYCGICPVQNFSNFGNLFPNITSTFHCKVKMAQFDYLFKRLDEEDVKKIFEKWVKYSQKKRNE
jgi:uncharacterized protein